MVRSALVLCILACAGNAKANTYTFDSKCQEAYHAILGLKFEEGSKLLAEAKAADPKNLIPVYLENYTDFLTVFIGEEEAVFKKLEKNKNKRLDLLEDGDASSPFHLFTQAELHLQWAFARLKFGEYVAAGLELRKAFHLLEENREKFPTFQGNEKGLGLLHALIGTIPPGYQWAVSLAGMSGSIKQGLSELRAITTGPNASTFIFRDEALIYYTFITLYFMNDASSAWELVDTAHIRQSGNLLNYFVAANVAMRTGHNNEAITLLSSRPGGPEYFPFHFLEYQLGLAKLRSLDSNASEHFQRFASNFKGTNYIKDAYQKMAWAALLEGNINAYTSKMELCEKRGGTMVDADKQANKELTQQRPHGVILAGRLLFDGGYMHRSRDTLKSVSLATLRSKRDSLELTYRLARVSHELGETKEATEGYLQTIQRGAGTNLYYPANSALQLGIHYESVADTARARTYFRKVLDMKGHEYKTSLDQKAKAGLNRLQDR